MEEWKRRIKVSMRNEEWLNVDADRIRT